MHGSYNNCTSNERHLQRQPYDNTNPYVTSLNYYNNNSLNSYVPVQEHQHYINDDHHMRLESTKYATMEREQRQQYTGYSHGRNVKQIEFEDAFF